MKSVARNDKKCWLEVTFSDGYQGRYPYVWLQDNCQRSESKFPKYTGRSIKMSSLDPDVVPTKAELAENGMQLQVTFPDRDYVSTYPAEWLKRNKFEKTTGVDSVREIGQVSWGGDFPTTTMKYFKYDDIMKSDKVLYEWLECIYRDAFCVVEDAPLEIGPFENLIGRIAYPKKTCQGTSFLVKNTPPKGKTEWSSGYIDIHNDFPCLEYRPCVHLLHCVREFESVGGDSTFVDGKRLYEELKKNDPELFKAATTIKIDYRLIESDKPDYHFQASRPLIELDDKGEFKSIAHFTIIRTPYVNLPVEQVQTMYRVLKKFDEMLYRKDLCMGYKMRDGDVICFDNNRLLHGRAPFQATLDPNVAELRLLEGGFVDWDEVKGRMRILHAKLNNTTLL